MASRIPSAYAIAAIAICPLAASPAGQTAAAGQAAPAALQIVIIAGADAVNIIQTQTAVNPIVEIRDRNGLPLSGVPVTFTVSGNSASFGASQTVSVVTNAAGRAAAGGLTPASPGVIQIQASASFQGQTASAVITQTNFATVAAATAAGATVAAGAATTAGAGAAGGAGLSATTIAIIGGAAAGGALYASQALKEEDAVLANGDYAGTFAIDPVETTTVKATGGICTSTGHTDGSVTLHITVGTNNAVTGVADITTSGPYTATTCPPPIAPALGHVEGSTVTAQITGTTEAIAFVYQRSQSDSFGTNALTATFAGSARNGVITGTLAVDQRSDSVLALTVANYPIPLTLH